MATAERGQRGGGAGNAGVWRGVTDLLAEVIADGRISAREWRQLRHEVREALAALAQLELVTDQMR